MTVLDREAIDHMRDRLRAAAEHLDEANQRQRLALATRNRLVIDAVDNGMAYRAVAKAAGVSQPHVVRILSRQDDID